MNPAEAALRRVDRAQQRFRPAAFVFGLIKKYGDDKGGVLVANLTYSAFVSIFPLLLVLTTILGLVAAGDEAFRQDALNAVEGQVPLIGKELAGNVHQLQKSSMIGLIAGLATLVYGTTRLAQAGLYAMEQVWNLPGPARPGFLPRLVRSLIFLLLLGVEVIATTLLASLATYSHQTKGAVFFAEAVEATVNAGMYLVGFRILTPRGVPTRDLVRGAIVAGILWTVLQVLGTYLVHHFLHSDSVYGVFATVLGLIAWLYLAAQITVYCAELNVILARRLWPRSIMKPPLTEADRASMALQALQNQRRKEQQVTVTFNDREPGAAVPSSTPQTPQDIAPPAARPGRRGWRREKQVPPPRDPAPAEQPEQRADPVQPEPEVARSPDAGA